MQPQMTSEIWSDHLIGFFSVNMGGVWRGCDFNAPSQWSFPNGTVSGKQVQAIICQSEDFLSFVELHSKVEHVLWGEGVLSGQACGASVPRDWLRLLPQPPWLFPARVFAFPVNRHLHYLLKKHHLKNNPVWKEVKCDPMLPTCFGIHEARTGLSKYPVCRNKAGVH